jgi:hypothetical protein
MPMLDRDTVIRSPHDVTVTRKGGRTERQVHDPRVSVAIQEEGATLTLFFDADTAWSGDAPLLEIGLSPTASGEFEPWRLLPNLPLHLQYARASLARQHGDVDAALRALRKVSSTRRGLSDDFLRIVAQIYESLVTEGERYPVKALAKAQHVDVSTASRWVTAARDRGLLEPPKEVQQ